MSDVGTTRGTAERLGSACHLLSEARQSPEAQIHMPPSAIAGAMAHTLRVVSRATATTPESVCVCVGERRPVCERATGRSASCGGVRRGPSARRRECALATANRDSRGTGGGAGPQPDRNRVADRDACLAKRLGPPAHTAHTPRVPAATLRVNTTTRLGPRAKRVEGQGPRTHVLKTEAWAEAPMIQRRNAQRQAETMSSPPHTHTRLSRHSAVYQRTRTRRIEQHSGRVAYQHMSLLGEQLGGPRLSPQRLFRNGKVQRPLLVAPGEKRTSDDSK